MPARFERSQHFDAKGTEKDRETHSRIILSIALDPVPTKPTVCGLAACDSRGPWEEERYIATIVSIVFKRSLQLLLLTSHHGKVEGQEDEWKEERQPDKPAGDRESAADQE